MSFSKKHKKVLHLKKFFKKIIAYVERAKNLPKCLIKFASLNNVKMERLPIIKKKYQI